MKMDLTQSEVEEINRLRQKVQKRQTVDEMFAFYKPIDDPNLKFANGEYAIQRDKKFYLKLIDTLIEAVKIHEAWILENKPYNGNLTREQVMGWSFLGRFLDDSGSDLYKWWGIQGNICRSCYREWGQMYYANHCRHDGVELDPVYKMRNRV